MSPSDPEPRSSRPPAEPSSATVTPLAGAESSRQGSRSLARQWRALLGVRPVAPAPLELRLLGRVALHSLLVGVVTGLAGSVLYGALEALEHVLLERAAGYEPLRASGEAVLSLDAQVPFRPYVLWILPALGGVGAGLVAHHFAPEVRGGGADAAIEAYHEHDGVVRRRVPLAKAVASILSLGTGGSGGREGPTMQIGSALGSLIARALRVGARERRVLFVAGMAAGMAAVFRTPLGAALLAVEVLHRDEFESEPLVPCVLASVVSYSVFVSFYGESHLFGTLPRYAFTPAHLPLYALLALFVSVMAALFVASLRTSERFFRKLAVSPWARPAVGGAVLGLSVVALLHYAAPRLGGSGRGLGLLGGGYGAIELSIRGTEWLGTGFHAALLLMALALAKIVASALTVGSGGSAGDFAPAFVIGGLAGGAFGFAARATLGDPTIDPGAFALVGMGTFYGGVAHVPLAALVMVCELAGSYDLLVPLMLSGGIAFVLLRGVALYPAQAEVRRRSASAPAAAADPLLSIRVRDVLDPARRVMTLGVGASATSVIAAAADAPEQDVFPVVDEGGRLVGILAADVVRLLAVSPDSLPFTIVHDLMGPAVCVRPDDSLRVALDVLLEQGSREVVVVDPEERVHGILDELDVVRVYQDRAEGSAQEPAR